MKFFYFILALLAIPALGKNIATNSVAFENAPEWVTERLIERVLDRIEGKLEWDIRKIRVTWISDLKAFDRKHGYGSSVTAFSLKNENAIYLSERVTEAKFEGTFGHELVHVILFQKYKDAIPKWLEEGLANFLSKNASAEYRLLKGTKLPNFQLMQHPFRRRSQGLTVEQFYVASLGLAEMLAAKCDLQDLLQLSVGKTLENYIQKTCEIQDIQKEFQTWVERH